jgi:hypothetical protein
MNFLMHETFFSLATVSSDYPLRINSLKGSIYYFNNNIWYKYTGITWQEDKYLMAEKNLRIPRKLKTETHKQLQIRTVPKREAKLFCPPPSIFKSREGNCPQLFRPWSGISEVRTVDYTECNEYHLN